MVVMPLQCPYSREYRVGGRSSRREVRTLRDELCEKYFIIIFFLPIDYKPVEVLLNYCIFIVISSNVQKTVEKNLIYQVFSTEMYH